MQKYTNFRTAELDGCIVSHNHGDHAAYIYQYIRAGIEVYGNMEVAEKHPGVHLIPERQRWKIGHFEVVPFNLPHEGVENYGYLIKTQSCTWTLFATDFEYFPMHFRNMKIANWIIAVNHDEVSDNHPAREHVLLGHSSVDTVKNILAVNKTKAMKNVLLIHMSDSIDRRAAVEAIGKPLRSVCVQAVKEGEVLTIYG